MVALVGCFFLVSHFLIGQQKAEKPSGALISSHAIAFNPLSRKVYAVDEARSTVNILDSRRGSSVEVKVGSGPDALAVNAKTGKVYVANSADGTVSEISGETDAVTATFKAGTHPYMIAVNEADSKVYVTNTFSDKIAVIDPGSQTTSFLQIGSADNLVVDSTENLVFLIGYEDPYVRILDGASQVTRRIKAHAHLWGMSFDEGSRQLYVTGAGTADLMAIHPSNSQATLIRVGSIPCAVAFSRKTKTIYVVNYGDNSVTVIDSIRDSPVATIPVGEGPQAITVDDRVDRAYVANTHAGSITVIDCRKNAVIATLPAGRSPYALVTGGSDGMVYVANLAEPSFTAVDARVLKFNLPLFKIRPAIALCSIAFLGAFTVSSQPGPNPTFSKDVMPILQKNCQVCHRPGEAAPFSMLTYERTRPWAVAMKEAVLTNKMPPWFADPKYGHFSNAITLSEAERQTIARWADSHAPQGDPKDLPPPAKFVEGWQIGQPDLVFQLPQPFHVPSSGVVDYQHVIVPSGFTKDTWVQAAEVRPTDRSVVHHIIAFVREPKSNWFKGQEPGVFFVDPQVKTEEEPDTSALPSDFLVGYAPGQPAEILRPGQAKLIKAGSDFVFQVHYTPNGREVMDQTRLGIVLAKNPPEERVLTLSATNGTFKIPPGDPDFRVEATFDIHTDVKLSGLHPHMHGRGKDFEYSVIYPTGEEQVLLNVPHFNWHWQNWYNLEQAISLPKGSKIKCVAHFDNSANNPDNADPTKIVSWGEQSWDEMMVGFFNLVFDAKMPVESVLGTKTKAAIASR